MRSLPAAGRAEPWGGSRARQAAIGNGAGGGPAAVRALTYHRFGHLPNNPFCIPPERLHAQIRWLTEQGRVVSLEDV